MTDIQAPDGTIARFPDDMPDGAITAVMKQHYPAAPAEQSPLSGPMPTAADLTAKGYGKQQTPLTSPNPYSYSVLPFSEDEQGNPHFDSNAGILGALKSAITLPGDVYSGKVDPESDEGIARAFGLAGLAGPVNAIGATKMLPQKVAVPTAEALGAAAAKGYDLARGLGVDYSSESVGGLASGLRGDLEQNHGVIRELAPKTFAILDKLGNPPQGSVAPLSGLEAARRTFGNAANDFTNPTEQFAAGKAKDALDEFMAGPPLGSVVAGPADIAARTLEDARGNYAAAARSGQLTSIADKADLNAAVANSGLNIDNSTRQRVRTLLNTPKLSAGFSPDELGALNEVARGTPARNAIRFVGNLLGGGGGLGAVVAGAAGGASGAALGGPIGAAVGASLPGAGVLSKLLANSLTEQSLANAANLVRQRSPLYAGMLAKSPQVSAMAGNALAVQRAALAAALNPQQE